MFWLWEYVLLTAEGKEREVVSEKKKFEQQKKDFKRKKSREHIFKAFPKIVTLLMD